MSNQILIASTMIGVGYKSNYLPGPHPTGVLLVDDIHNEENTRSDRELNKLFAIYKGTILPMIEPETFHALIGTPWNDYDIIADRKKNKMYIKLYTPIVTNIPVLGDVRDGKVMEGKPWEGDPVWPEKWGPKEIRDKYETNVIIDIGW